MSDIDQRMRRIYDDPGLYAAYSLGQAEAWRRRDDIRHSIEAERDRLRAALERYGNHRPSCEIECGGCGSACDCGFLSAIDGEEEVKP